MTTTTTVSLSYTAVGISRVFDFYHKRQSYWEPLTGIYEFVINLWQTNYFKSSPKNLPVKPIKLWAVSENASSRNTIDGMELTTNRPEEPFYNTYFKNWLCHAFDHKFYTHAIKTVKWDWRLVILFMDCKDKAVDDWIFSYQSRVNDYSAESVKINRHCVNQMVFFNQNSSCL